MKPKAKHSINVNGQIWDFEKSILDSAIIGDKVVVIFDYMEYPKNKHVRNFVAFDLYKNELWVGEHPTNEIIDAYTSITNTNPLQANNFASYSCTINIETGELLNKVFYK